MDTLKSLDISKSRTGSGSSTGSKSPSRKPGILRMHSELPARSNLEKYRHGSGHGGSICIYNVLLLVGLIRARGYSRTH